MGKVYIAILSAIVQGLTEFLPVSSSGHLMLCQHFFKTSIKDKLLFDIILHVGTLISIFFMYRKVILELIFNGFHFVRSLIMGNCKIDSYYKRLFVMLTISISPLFITFIFHNFYKSIFVRNNMTVLGCCFLINAIVLFVANTRKNGNKSADNMKYTDALMIGLAQAILAPIPGISRSGIIIAVGLLFGLSIRYSIMYAFLLGIPTILGACLLEIPKSMVNIKSTDAILSLVGMLITSIVGCFSIKLLEKSTKINKFSIFSFYMLFVGVFTLYIRNT